jgi:hypothetical protein
MSFKRRNIIVRFWFRIYNFFTKRLVPPKELRDRSLKEFMEKYNAKQVQDQCAEAERKKS